MKNSLLAFGSFGTAPVIPSKLLLTVLNIIQLSTNLWSPVGNLNISVFLGVLRPKSFAAFSSIFFSAFFLSSELSNASSDIFCGTFDILIPVFIAIKSSNAPDIFELNDTLRLPNAELRSSLIDPNNLDLRFLKKLI